MPVVRNLAAKLYIARYPNPVICRHNEQHVPHGTDFSHRNVHKHCYLYSKVCGELDV